MVRLLSTWAFESVFLVSWHSSGPMMNVTLKWSQVSHNKHRNLYGETWLMLSVTWRNICAVCLNPMHKISITSSNRTKLSTLSEGVMCLVFRWFLLQSLAPCIKITAVFCSLMWWCIIVPCSQGSVLGNFPLC